MYKTMREFKKRFFSLPGGREIWNFFIENGGIPVCNSLRPFQKHSICYFYVYQENCYIVWAFSRHSKMYFSILNTIWKNIPVRYSTPKDLYIKRSILNIIKRNITTTTNNNNINENNISVKIGNKVINNVIVEVMEDRIILKIIDKSIAKYLKNEKQEIEIKIIKKRKKRGG